MSVSGKELAETLSRFSPKNLFCLASANHRLKNLHIPRAATQVSCQPVANLCICGIWVSFQQIDCCQHHPGRTDAALCSAAIDKCLLHRVELVVVGHTFNGRNRGAIGLCDRYKTAVYYLSINQYGARTTLAFATTFLSSRKLQL